MKTEFWKFLLIFALAISAAGCTYDKLPPKTGSGTMQYVLPKGEIPTAEDRAELDAIRAEYEAYISSEP